MPTYKYECDRCKDVYEVVQSIIDPPHEVCAGCGGSLHRVLYAVPFRWGEKEWRPLGAENLSET